MVADGNPTVQISIHPFSTGLPGLMKQSCTPVREAGQSRPPYITRTFWCLNNPTCNSSSKCR
jgi:hypothetical protein